MQFTISDRIIKNVREPLIGDNADYIATFSFDDEWTGKVKTARFVRCGMYVDKILENDSCIIPVEVLKRGAVAVGVFSDEMTTTYCTCFIMESIKESDGSPIPPTPDIYAQIIKMIEDIEHQKVPEEDIEKAIADYLAKHPIQELTPEDVETIIEAYFAAHHSELKGDTGPQGPKGDPGEPGPAGRDGVDGAQGPKGDPGEKGADGKDGEQGPRGADGAPGPAGKDGVDGAPGADGDSAYTVAVNNGFIGTEEQWLESLKGNPGAQGPQGEQGPKGDTGEAGPQGEPGPKGDKGDSGIPALNLVEVSEGIANVTMLPNRLYFTQTPCTQITVALEPIQELIYAEYMLCFITDSACVLTMPENIMWDGGEAPTLEANKYYELSVLNNVAVISRGASL